MSSIPFTYINNKDNQCNFFLYDKSEYSKIDDFPNEFDVNNYFINHDYGDIDLELSFRFHNVNETFENTPTIKFKLNDNTEIEVTTTDVVADDYEYRFNLNIYRVITSDDKEELRTSINNTVVKIDNIQSIEISCGFAESEPITPPLSHIIPITYINNRDNACEVNFYCTSESETLGNNINNIDIPKYWSDKGYKSPDDLIFRLEFKTSEKYDAQPFINFKVKDELKTANVIISDTSTYQYYFPLDIFAFVKSDDTEVLTTQSIDNNNIAIDDIDSIEISCGLIEILPTEANLENTFNTIGVYQATESTIKQLLSDTNRFKTRVASYQPNENELDINIQQFNLTEYILKFYKSFFKLDFEQLNQNLTLNGYALNIQMNERRDLIAIFETDELLLDGYYHNALDYDSDIHIFIPLYNIYKLDTKYINHKIKFRFICDIVNNQCNIEVKIDDITIDVLSCSMGYEIPLIKSNVESTKITNTFLFANNNIEINIFYHSQINNHIVTDKKDYIKNCQGYFKANELQIDDNSILSNELDELLTLLESGCYNTSL